MRLRFSFLFALVALGALVAAGCSDDGPYPYGGGDIGAPCRAHSDCVGAFCCTSPPCGHGTCSYRCAVDADCPYGALCEGDVCYWSCRSDVECLVGQHCKRDRGLCQY